MTSIDVSGRVAAADDDQMPRVDLGVRVARRSRQVTHARHVVAAYLGLTKPRIIELLLVTTVPAMFLAAGGVPPLELVLTTMIGGCLASLQPMKAWLVAEQYVHKAEEGQWLSTGGHGEGGFTYDRRGVSNRRAG